MLKKILSACMLLSLAACAGGPSMEVAAPKSAMVSLKAGASSMMPDGASTDAPRGYLEMCRSAPGDCGRAKSGVDLAAADAMRLLDRVNRRVNESVIQVTDVALYGRGDVWTRPLQVRNVSRGDCEDIAIEKRHQLIDAGFPAEKLFYAVVYRHDLGLHAVLIARTDSGDVVLDNRTPWIQSWDQAPYVWVKRQSMADPMVWERVPQPVASPADVVVAEADVSEATGAGR